MTKKKQNQDYQAIAEQLAAENAQLTEALQRERADATNVRRRAEEDMTRLGSVHKAKVIRELLPVVDNFERALGHIPKDLAGNDFIKGIEGIIKQFENTLSKLGVQRIKTVGEPFDPHLHEAVSHEAGKGGQEVVAEELQSGYLLGDEVVRHAMVRTTD